MCRVICLILLSAIASTFAAAPATQPASRPALNWGKASEGVQSAIQPGEARFAAGQRVGFLVSVRNSGQRDLFVARSQETCEIEVDGKWYHFFGDVDVKSSPLPPGREYRDICLWLDADWAPLGDHARLKLTSGKHTLRVAVIAQNEQAFEPAAKAISQQVEFEVP